MGVFDVGTVEVGFAPGGVRSAMRVMTITPKAQRSDPDLLKFFDSFALLP